MSDETVEIDYDQECIFRTSDNAWYLLLEYDSAYSKNNKGAFFSKKHCVLNKTEKTVTVPVWLAEKMGLI